MEMESTLHLIREELKIRKFFNTLREIGLADCYFESDLGFLILKSLGLNDGKDETYYYYSDLMDKHSKKISEDQDSIRRQAVKAYNQLVKSKKMNSE